METALSVQVKELKESFTKLGIAEYRISGLDEEASLVSYIRQKESFRYAFLRDPYSRSKNLIWRLIKVDIWRPSLPMGYIYSPGFCFDYMGTEPLKEAVKLANLLMGQKYKARFMDDERASMRQVKEESIKMTDADIEYLKQRNYSKVKWQ